MSNTGNLEPKFTIVLRVSRNDELLKRAIDSLIPQEPNEVIAAVDPNIIKDKFVLEQLGRVDAKIIQQRLGKLEDRAVTFFPNLKEEDFFKHWKHSTSYYDLFKESSHAWIRGMDDDDVMLTDTRKEINEHSGNLVGCIYGRVKAVDNVKNDTFMRDPKTVDDLYGVSNVLGSTNIFRKIAVLDAIRYCPDICPMSSWIMFYWMKRVGWHFIRSDEIYSEQHIHGKNFAQFMPNELREKMGSWGELVIIMNKMNLTDWSGAEGKIELASFWKNLEQDDKHETFLRDGGRGIENPTRQKIYDIIESTGVKTVLECGCGTGVDYEGLDNRGLHNKINYTGTDGEQKMVEWAVKNYPKGKFQQAHIQKLPFPSASFDLVYCKDVLEHLPYYDTAINEMIRVAKKYLVIGLFLVKLTGEDHIKHVQQGNQEGVYQNYYNIRKMVDYIKSILYCDVDAIKTSKNMLNEDCYVLHINKRFEDDYNITFGKEHSHMENYSDENELEEFGDTLGNFSTITTDDRPTVTIGMLVSRSGYRLKRAVDSILNMYPKPDEILCAVDTRLKDDKFVRKQMDRMNARWFLQYVPPPRYVHRNTVLHPTKFGLYWPHGHSYCEIFRRARGDWVGFCDDDDEIEINPKKVVRKVPDDVAEIYGNVRVGEVIDKVSGLKPNSWRIANDMGNGDEGIKELISCSKIYRRSAVLPLINYIDWGHSYDWTLAFFLKKAGWKFMRLDELFSIQHRDDPIRVKKPKPAWKDYLKILQTEHKDTKEKNSVGIYAGGSFKRFGGPSVQNRMRLKYIGINETENLHPFLVTNIDTTFNYIEKFYSDEFEIFKSNWKHYLNPNRLFSYADHYSQPEKILPRRKTLGEQAASIIKDPNWSFGPSFLLRYDIDILNSHKCILQSQFRKDECARLGIKPDNMTLIYNIVETDILKPIEQKNDQKFRVGWIGPRGDDNPFNKIKYGEMLIWAANQNKDMDFEVIGSFPFENIPKNNKVHDYLPHLKMPEIIRHWDTGLFTSKTEWAPIGITEVMSCGLPVIAPNHTGFKELAYNQILINVPTASPSKDEIYMDRIFKDPKKYDFPDDVKQKFNDKLHELRDNLDLRKKLGDAGRKLVIERHSGTKIGRQWIKFFENCISEVS